MKERKMSFFAICITLLCIAKSPNFILGAITQKIEIFLNNGRERNSSFKNSINARISGNFVCTSYMKCYNFALISQKKSTTQLRKGCCCYNNSYAT